MPVYYCYDCARASGLINPKLPASGLAPSRLLALIPKNETPRRANDAAWIFALSSLPRDYLARPIQWSKHTLADKPQEKMYLNTLGALLYRAGRYEESIRRLEEAIQVQGKGGTVHDWLFLAMAYQRIDQPTEAQKWPHQAVEWIEKQKAAEVGTPASPSWALQVELELLRREAEEFLPSRNPR